MDNSSGVGVLDKAALVLSALESGPATLAGLVGATGLARPTAHRLAVALEHHRMVARDMQGRFILGPRLAELAAAAGEDDPAQITVAALHEAIKAADLLAGDQLHARVIDCYSVKPIDADTLRAAALATAGRLVVEDRVA